MKVPAIDALKIELEKKSISITRLKHGNNNFTHNLSQVGLEKKSISITRLKLSGARWARIPLLLEKKSISITRLKPNSFRLSLYRHQP